MKDSSIQLRSESRLIVTEELASQLVALSTLVSPTELYSNLSPAPNEARRLRCAEG